MLCNGMFCYEKVSDYEYDPDKLWIIHQGKHEDGSLGWWLWYDEGTGPTLYREEVILNDFILSEQPQLIKYQLPPETTDAPWCKYKCGAWHYPGCSDRCAY